MHLDVYRYSHVLDFCEKSADGWLQIFAEILQPHVCENLKYRTNLIEQRPALRQILRHLRKFRSNFEIPLLRLLFATGRRRCPWQFLKIAARSNFVLLRLLTRTREQIRFIDCNQWTVSSKVKM